MEEEKIKAKKLTRKKILPPVKHGLYIKRRAIDKLDGRRREVRAWKVFISGIAEDLGDLSFGQKALAELAFWKYYALSEFMRTLLMSGKDGAVLAIMTSERHNRQFNCTSNSFRGDLREIYGPIGLKKTEKKVEDLETYLAQNYTQEGGDGQ